VSENTWPEFNEAVVAALRDPSDADLQSYHSDCELFVAFFFRRFRNDFENVALQLRIVRKKT
jgi:hypothetical protein